MAYLWSDPTPAGAVSPSCCSTVSSLLIAFLRSCLQALVEIIWLHNPKFHFYKYIYICLKWSSFWTLFFGICLGLYCALCIYTWYQVKEWIFKIVVFCTSVEHRGHKLFLCLLQGQAGWSLEHPGLVEVVPGHGRDVGPRWSLGSLPIQAILCFYDFILHLQCTSRDFVTLLAGN